MSSQLLQEHRSLLEGRVTAFLGTNGEDGLPHVVPMWMLPDFEVGRIHICTSSATVKVRNLRTDDRASITVHVEPQPMAVRGVLLQGRIAIVDGEEARARNRIIHEHYLDAAVLRRPKVAGYLAGDDVTLVFTPLRARSWDESHLQE